MPGGQTINTPSGTYTIADGGELYADLVNRGIVDPQHSFFVELLEQLMGTCCCMEK